MDGTIFAAHPDTANEVGRDTNKPSVGIIVGRARLAADVHAVGKATHVIISEQGRRSAAFEHTGTEHLLHIESGARTQNVVHGRVGLIDDMAVAVDDALDEHGRHVLAAVGHGGIGIDHLQEVDIARAERQRGHIAQL